MLLTRTAAGIVIVLCLQEAAPAAMYGIENPAGKITNPADTMYNPAAQVNNPAANIYNPASRMNNPSPLSPPTQAVPDKTVTAVTPAIRPVRKIRNEPQVKPAVRYKNYQLKTAREYIGAAKKAFIRDDFSEFISITEDALRRIQNGTLKASGNTRKILIRYRTFGYGLLE